MVGYRAARAVQERLEDDEDFLVQLDLIPRTHTKKLEGLLSRSKALLSQCDSTSALGAYAKRQRDAIASELAIRHTKTLVPKRLPIGGPPVVVSGGDGGINVRAKRLAEKRALRASALTEAEQLIKTREQRRQAAIARLTARQQRRKRRKLQRQPRKTAQSSESESVSDSDDSSTEASVVCRQLEACRISGAATYDQKEAAAPLATNVDDDNITIERGAITDEAPPAFIYENHTHLKNLSSPGCRTLEEEITLPTCTQDGSVRLTPVRSATEAEEHSPAQPHPGVEHSMHEDLASPQTHAKVPLELKSAQTPTEQELSSREDLTSMHSRKTPPSSASVPTQEKLTMRENLTSMQSPKTFPSSALAPAEEEIATHESLTSIHSPNTPPIYIDLGGHGEDDVSEHDERLPTESVTVPLQCESLEFETTSAVTDESKDTEVLSQQDDEVAASTQQSPSPQNEFGNEISCADNVISCDGNDVASSTCEQVLDESISAKAGSKTEHNDEDTASALRPYNNNDSKVVAKEQVNETDYAGMHSTWWSIFSQWSTWTRIYRKHRVRNPPPGDVRLAMNRQWRLYTVYESVMADYATVFSSWTKSRIVYDGNSAALHFRVNSSRPEVFDIVTHVLTNDPAFVGHERWIELPSGLGLKTTWNLLWTWSKPRIDYSHLLSWQRVNHYPNSRHLTRKDLLARSLARMATLVEVAPEATAKKYKGAFDVSPVTFLLPQDYCSLMKKFKDSYWIMKPVGLSRGRGISLVTDVEDLTYADPVVVQEYVSRPLLLDNYKFDLRLYVLVTSFSPLEAFVYGDGFARLATRPFSLNAASDKLVHLTNASIQKKVGEMPLPLRSATAQEAGGTKCSLVYLWQKLKQQRSDFDQEKTWRDICLVILKSLVCVEDNIAHQTNSFEVFGYDVILDADCRPWLLEVNASPSMARESKLDATIKEAMIRDTVRLVNPVRYDRTQLVEILDRRLREMEGALTLLPDSTAQGMVNADLNKILGGGRLRAYGQPPAHPGAYEMIAPGPLHDQIRRIKRALVAPRNH